MQWRYFCERREEEDIGYVLRFCHSLHEFVLVGYTQFVKYGIIIKALCPSTKLFMRGVIIFTTSYNQ